MKATHSLKMRLSVYAGILIAFLLVLIGRGWSIEWDVHSGRERRVAKVWGIALTYGEPMPTIVSQWHQGAGEGEQWMVVASGPREGADLEGLGRVVCHFELMSTQVVDVAWKEAYARWVLRELAETGSICRVGDHCNRVGRVLIDTDGEMTLERLRHIWHHTARSGGQTAVTDTK